MSKNRNRNRHRNNNNVKTETRQHIVLPDVEMPKISEPRPVCLLCNEPIESIAEAISESGGAFSHFDCVINKLKEHYNVKEPDIISYIGCGTFAICSKSEEDKYIIKEKITYESTEAFNSMKKFIEENRHEQ